MEGTPRAKRRRGREAVYAGFALHLSERRAVVSSRGASVRLWGRVDSPRQDRKALRKPGFPIKRPSAATRLSVNRTLPPSMEPEPTFLEIARILRAGH